MSEVDQPFNLSVSAPALSALANSASILVIDDEAGIRESLEVLLTLEGYGVRTAMDGEQGLRILELENFDLVLLDLALPGQSGLELLPQIPRDRLVVSESGIREHADLTRLGSAGVKAVLVGETLMRAPDIGSALDRLRGIRKSGDSRF